MIRPASVAITLSALLMSVVAGLAEEWRAYTDPGHRYAIDLPVTSFAMQSRSGTSGHMSLTEIGGDAVIDIYTGANAKHLSPADFAAELSQAGEIKDITYQARGQSWFVISGHYASVKPPLIYYAKYMFSDGMRAVAGFEVSYPVNEKARMDPIVTHLERSLHIPKG
jgi:hypothetical protein